MYKGRGVVIEHMQVPTCASKYLPCVTKKGTCICSITNPSTYSVDGTLTAYATRQLPRKPN